MKGAVWKNKGLFLAFEFFELFNVQIRNIPQKQNDLFLFSLRFWAQTWFPPWKRETWYIFSVSLFLVGCCCCLSLFIRSYGSIISSRIKSSSHGMITSPWLENGGPFDFDVFPIEKWRLFYCYCWWLVQKSGENTTWTCMRLMKPVVINGGILPYQLVFSPDFLTPSTVCYVSFTKRVPWISTPKNPTQWGKAEHLAERHAVDHLYSLRLVVLSTWNLTAGGPQNDETWKRWLVF